MPNSIKTNILYQNFAHYNNKDTLKLPKYFFKISPNLVTLEVRTPKFNIKIHLRGGQPLTTFLKNYILQFSGTRWRDYFSNISPICNKEILPYDIKNSKVVRAKIGCELNKVAKNCPKAYLYFLTLAKFRQIWSHYSFSLILTSIWLIFGYYLK